MVARNGGMRLPFTGPAAGGPRNYAEGAFDHVLAGLPPDVALKALKALSSRNLDPSSVYSLPLLTSDTVTVPASGSTDLNFQFPTLGVIYGISWNAGGLDLSAGDLYSTLSLSLRDVAATVQIVGTESIPFNLTGIPQACMSGASAAGVAVSSSANYLRVSPWAVYQTNPLDGTITVGTAGLSAAAAGVTVNLLGLGLWLPGQQIT